MHARVLQHIMLRTCQIRLNHRKIMLNLDTEDDDELTIILGDEKDYFDYDHSIEFESDILKKHFKTKFEDLNSDKKTDLIMIFPEERQIMLLESDIE